MAVTWQLPSYFFDVDPMVSIGSMAYYFVTHCSAPDLLTGHSYLKILIDRRLNVVAFTCPLASPGISPENRTRLGRAKFPEFCVQVAFMEGDTMAAVSINGINVSARSVY